jgi:hypothetical protein
MKWRFSLVYVVKAYSACISVRADHQRTAGAVDSFWAYIWAPGWMLPCPLLINCTQICTHLFSLYSYILHWRYRPLQPWISIAALSFREFIYTTFHGGWKSPRAQEHTWCLAKFFYRHFVQHLFLPIFLSMSQFKAQGVAVDVRNDWGRLAEVAIASYPETNPQLDSIALLLESHGIIVHRISTPQVPFQTQYVANLRNLIIPLLNFGNWAQSGCETNVTLCSKLCAGLRHKNHRSSTTIQSKFLPERRRRYNH